MLKNSNKINPYTKSTCILYCRVSSFSQSSGTSVSLEAQEMLAKKMANSKGYRIKKVCKEVGSAYKTSMNSLKEILTSNKNTCIIMYDVSRFCRDVSNGLDMLNMALSKNNTLIFVYDKLSINLKNKCSKIAKFKLLLEQAERESAKIGSRVKTSRQYLKDNGKYNGGSVPYGYLVTKSTHPEKNNLLVKDKHEQKIITFIKTCKKSVIISKEINTLMRKISTQNPYIKIICYDKDQETPLTSINSSLTNIEIAKLLNDYGVKKRGQDWSVYSVNRVKSDSVFSLELKTSDSESFESEDESFENSDISNPNNNCLFQHLFQSNFNNYIKFCSDTASEYKIELDNLKYNKNTCLIKQNILSDE